MTTDKPMSAEERAQRLISNASLPASSLVRNAITAEIRAAEDAALERAELAVLCVRDEWWGNGYGACDEAARKIRALKHTPPSIKE